MKNTSRTPRFSRPASASSQHPADSPHTCPQAGHVLAPVQAHPGRDIEGLVADLSIANLDMDHGDEEHHTHRLQRPGGPDDHLLKTLPMILSPMPTPHTSQKRAPIPPTIKPLTNRPTTPGRRHYHFSTTTNPNMPTNPTTPSPQPGHNYRPTPSQTPYRVTDTTVPHNDRPTPLVTEIPGQLPLQHCPWLFCQAVRAGDACWSVWRAW